MAKPPTSVRSIRLPDAMWASVTARAELHGLSVNAFVAQRLADPPTVAEPGDTRPVGFEERIMRTGRATVASKQTADQIARTWGRPQVQYGPVQASPGSRLKGAKK